jgi:hypothetical protein
VQHRVIAVDHEGTGLLVEPGGDQDACERGGGGGALVELQVDGQPIEKICLDEESRRLAAARRFAGALGGGRIAHERSLRSKVRRERRAPGGRLWTLDLKPPVC